MFFNIKQTNKQTNEEKKLTIFHRCLHFLLGRGLYSGQRNALLVNGEKEREREREEKIPLINEMLDWGLIKVQGLNPNKVKLNAKYETPLFWSCMRELCDS